MSKKKIMVIYGGISAEREISIISSKEISKALKRLNYEVIEVDADPGLLKEINFHKPDIVFNALHGTWGEDGCVQGLLEIMNIPYTHSGVRSSALAMNKIMSKKLYKTINIPCAEDRIIKCDVLFDRDPMKRPFVVKPYNDGSSVGVRIIGKGDEFRRELSGPWKDTDQLMVERYIPGRELTVSVMGDRALCVTELKPINGFYDYKSKYKEGMTEHILPAELHKDQTERLKNMAIDAHNVLGCRGVSRSDFRMDGDDIFILETNTQPGMTPLSLVPEQAKYMGISFNELVHWMMEDASCVR